MKKFYSLMLVMLLGAATSLFAADAPQQDYVQNYISLGKFSVSPTKMVYLCKSNLFYKASEDKMYFRDRASDRMDNSNQWASENYDGLIDCMGWGSSGYYDAPKPWRWKYTLDEIYNILPHVRFGYGFHDGETFTVLENGKYVQMSMDYYDWAYQYAINGFNRGTFRCLSSAEWKYILLQRPNAHNLRALGTVDGIKGLILLPDNWHTPCQVEFTPYIEQEYEGEIYPLYSYQASKLYTNGVNFWENWDLMEEAGAVFLPLTGYRSEGKEHADWSEHGWYWTASSYASEETYYADGFDWNESINIYQDIDECFKVEGHPRNLGAAVRLARNEYIDKSQVKLIQKETINLTLNSQRYATWTNTKGTYYFTKAGTYYWTDLEADGHNDWLYTIKVKGPDELYAVLEGTSLIFYYDGYITARGGMQYWKSTSETANAWREKATKVVFNSSMISARPTSTAGWFKDCENITSFTNMEYLHTDDVTNMSEMFRGCKSITKLDLRSFNMKNVTNINNMFYNCENLRTIYCNEDWNNLKKIQSGSDVFIYCFKLVGGKGTVYDANHLDYLYARPDKKNGQPGYFWADGDNGSDPNISPEPEPDPNHWEALSDCEISSTGSYEFVRSLIMDEPNESEIALAFLTQDDWLIDWGTDEYQITSNGKMLVLWLEPENKEDLRGKYSLKEKNLSEESCLAQYTKGELYPDIVKISAGSVEVSLSELGDSYNLSYSLSIDGKRVSGTVSGICADVLPEPEKDIIIDPEDPWGLENIQPSVVRSQKVLRNGQLYLIYEGKMYDVQGRRIEN